MAGGELKSFGRTPEEVFWEKALEEACSILSAEINIACGGGQAVVMLAGARNDFKAWDNGQEDGPMPPIATPERLRG